MAVYQQNISGNGRVKLPLRRVFERVCRWERTLVRDQWQTLSKRSISGMSSPKWARRLERGLNCRRQCRFHTRADALTAIGKANAPIPFCRQCRLSVSVSGNSQSPPNFPLLSGLGYAQARIQKSAQRNFWGNELRRHMIYAERTTLSQWTKSSRAQRKNGSGDAAETSDAL